ncbi:ABC transporter permease [Alkalihalobacillus trypoxylicola]|uniref:ABC transmembrane type-2 domain-containing protein n=1 Tax=Alkalihalobacillus trypoxylicola TaxID=519424 RepID=A0A161PXT2_9BACI|nr:ABC transporter permease [Alkalihalobacillus trypoxylicola]KYG27052.1 hypothetical protein AZF04_12015 [Alkalihalobacillus trypoxylicola]
MRSILWGEWRQLLKKPFSVIGMIVLTIVFAIIIGFSGQSTHQTIPVYSESLSESELIEELKSLNESKMFHYSHLDRSAIEAGLTNQSYEMAIELGEKRYKLFVSRESKFQGLLERELTSYFVNKQPNEQSSNNLFEVSFSSYSNEEVRNYDHSLHSLFGFSLFFVFYTVMFSVQSILEQRESGVWDRIILSPTTKSSLFLGHLLFSFILGYGQLMIIYCIFYYGFQLEFYGGFYHLLIAVIPYLLATVSLGVLLSGLVSNSKQLNGVIPIVSVSMAMLGGAYWPLDIVTSDILLFISNFIPMTYGVEILKGATIYDWSFHEFLLPISILFGMSALFMGVGLNLMERRAKITRG